MYGLTELYTGITPGRLAKLIEHSYCCHEMPGVFAEFGVAQGGSLDMLAALHPNRTIYGIDSFSGLPAPTEWDTHKEGEFAISSDEYYNLLKHFKKYPNVKIFRGFSPNVFETLPQQDYAFVHVDVDMYSSVSHALDYFYPRLLQGGCMIFDDYGFDSTPGAKRAIDEFTPKCSFRRILEIEGRGRTGQYIIIK